MSDQLDFVWRQLPNLLWGFPNNRPGGLLLTILLSSGAIAAGLGLAILLGLGRHSTYTAVRFAVGRVIWVLRGVPLIVLLVLLFQILGTGRLIGIELSAFWTAAVTLTLYAAAYFADIIAAGITSVPQQLRDDAQLMGAGPFALLRTVTVPYALRVMRPALTTQAITVFKDSSVVVVLGVADLTTTADIVLGSDVGNAPFWVATYVVVGFLYWSVAFALSRWMHAGERVGARRLLAHG